MDWGWAVTALEQHGLLGIFVVVALEYACLPMPSEVLLPLAGLAAAAAGFPLALVTAVSVLAGLTGSALCYALGAYGGRALLERLLRRFPRAWAQLEETSRWQAETGGLSMMVARVIPLFRTWISFVAGIVRMPFGAFALYSAMGMIVWNTVLLGAGYSLFVTGATMDGLSWVLPAGGLLMLVGGFVVRRLLAARRARRNPSAAQAVKGRA